MIWKADAVQVITRALPLHKVLTINLVAVQAIPDIGTRQGCHRPMIAFAFHFFSVRIFPICPRDLGIFINVSAQNDNREFHGVPFCVGMTLYRTITV